jgi:glucose/arabinose dehydrogenase
VPAVHFAGQGGLGDVAVHPQFSFNRRIYLSYVESGANGTSGAVLGYGLLDRNGRSAKLTNFRVIWRQTPKVSGDGHFSHRIAFAPDGTIFLSSGDRQQMQPAQDLGSDLGKMIHMTDDGDAVPGGPFAGSGGRAATYWSMGHRNMLGVAFAPDGRLWSTEMGPMGGDELNLILPGRNYGWPLASYGSHYTGEDIPDDHDGQGFEEPKLWWNPVIAPAGLIIYTGTLFPQWQGDALMAALAGRALVRADIQGDSATKAEEWDMDRRIREVEQGPSGEIYLLEDDGRLLRLEPAS